MDTRIRPARALNIRLTTAQFPRRPEQFPLHRTGVLLHLPAPKAGAIILDQ
jgi:hypothetical protein